MRKSIATIAALAAVALTGISAGPAAADDPNVRYSQGGTLGGSRTLSCETQMKYGVVGGWGLYLDGCTVTLSCPTHHIGAAVRSCTINNYSRITTSIPRGDQVTMNSRIRTINSYGQVTGWRDKSCAGAGSCTIADTTVIYPRQSASVQCNGVRANTWDNRGQVRCGIEVKTPTLW